MSFAPRDYLSHILAEADYLVEHSVGRDLTSFLADDTLQRAFVRSIEVMGEAAKHLSPDFRSAHPEIDWRSLAGMRDRLIHGYFGVDYEIVWDVVQTKVPELQKQIASLLRSLTAG